MSKKSQKSDLESKMKKKIEEIEDEVSKDEDQSESFDQSSKGKPENPREKVLELDAYEFYKNYDPSQNKYDPWLTIFERTNVLGVRATQIENGAEPLVDVPEGVENVVEIAEMELAAGKAPLIICREGREFWRVTDLADIRS